MPNKMLFLSTSAIIAVAFGAVLWLYAHQSLSAEVKCLDELLPVAPSQSFGYSLATDGNRLAIGEPLANRVHVFEQQENSLWKYVTAISYPEAVKATYYGGNGFGHSIALSGDHLIIGDFVEAVENSPKLRAGTDGWIRRHGVYLVNLSTNPPSLTKIFDKAMVSEAIYGFAVAVSNSHVAAAYRTQNSQADSQSGVLVSPITSTDKVRSLKAPKSSGISFGYSIDLDGQRLLGNNGGIPAAAWLNNLSTNDHLDISGTSKLPIDLSAFSVSLAGNLIVLAGFAGDSEIAIMSSSALLRLDGGSYRLLGEVRPGGPAAANDKMGVFASTRTYSIHDNPDGISQPSKLVVIQADGKMFSPVQPKITSRIHALAIGNNQVIVSYAKYAGNNSCRVVTFPIDTLLLNKKPQNP